MSLSLGSAAWLVQELPFNFPLIPFNFNKNKVYDINQP